MFNPKKDLSVEEKKECRYVAYQRCLKRMIDDENKHPGAGYSFGKKEDENKKKPRTIEQKLENEFQGAIAECISSKFIKCIWTKEIDQYKGNEKPDLQPTFRKKIVNCEVRGTGKIDKIIHRPSRDNEEHKKNYILVCVTNLPNGPCRIGWIFFKDLTILGKEHPEWKIEDNRGAPFYWIPFEYLSENFSEFGE